MSSAPESTCVCENCGEPYVPVRRKALAAYRFCSFRCQRLARKPKAAAGSRAIFSEVIGLPYPPDLSEGRCATAPAHLRHLWTSRYAADRHAAKLICLACPVLEACRDWALSLPVTDTATYGGMSWSERQAVRKARALAS